MRARAVPDGIAATRSAKATKEIAETTPISVTLTTNRIPATLPLPMVAAQGIDASQDGQTGHNNEQSVTAWNGGHRRRRDHIPDRPTGRECRKNKSRYPQFGVELGYHKR
ncbi:hypothetical protein MRGA423_01580 [Mycobacterium tuberculosis RGTB423]|nr:hypothetical protein MRGA423_01580 [Mycobacterium tuberculosis RGTB423]